jgi:hypothetical protein
MSTFPRLLKICWRIRTDSFGWEPRRGTRRSARPGIPSLKLSTPDILPPESTGIPENRLAQRDTVQNGNIQSNKHYLGNVDCWILYILLKLKLLNCLRRYTWNCRRLTGIFSGFSTEVTNMKLLIRASILSLAVAGLVAGFSSSHSATAQAAALSHQTVSGVLPSPSCGPQSCDIRGTGTGN